MKKMFKTRASMLHVLVVLLFATLLNISCVKERIKPDNSDTKDKAEYDLIVMGGDGSKPLLGENIDSNWDPSLGIVWLGTDENNLPTGTLTIIIDTVVTTSGLSQAIITSAALSTSDKLVGTGPEINAKTYLSLSKDELLEGGAEHGFQWIDSVVIGANYISGKIGSGKVDDDVWEPWVMKDANTGELAAFWGTFTAIAK
jgi:hypothetical protein